MQLHHHIQPHHHITLWIACALILVLTVVTTSTPTQTAAQGSPDPHKIFAEEEQEEIVKFEQIPACQQTNNLAAKEKSLYAESSQVINELDTLRDIFQPNRTDAQKVRISELEARHARIEADLAANKTELEALSNKSGPSDQCKTALVAAVIKNTTKYAVKMPAYIAELDNVSEIIDKIEKSLPELRQASNNETLLKSIEDDINTIQSSVKILKSFFNDMKNQMDNFISLAATKPIEAYDIMEKFGDDESRFKKSKATAETMTAALNRLKSSLKTLTNPSPQT